jgi:aryl-alcohol dehydrogenase-like predicted oxidoreductase
MKYSKLGRTGLEVSRVCLGTMTWGQQNTEAEGHEQMDYAVGQGINFFDTAELYAVPPSAESYGRTEEIIGTWFAQNNKRQDIILATKVTGRGMPNMPYDGYGDWVRGDKHKADRQNIEAAVEASLKRLQTDYIDLYQLHNPNRENTHFIRHWAGAIDFEDTTTGREIEEFVDILETMNDLVKVGKIKHFGISDDSPWAMMTYLQLAEKHNLPRIESIQNEYSLMKRNDQPYLSEVCVREDVAYLPWSPLAGGMISGKYLDGARPEGSRWSLDSRPNGRDTETSQNTVKAYMAVAEKHGLDVCQMALKFVDKQNFVTSTIIGATTMEQLKTDIDAFEIELSDEVMADIDKVYRQFPIPY